MEDVSVQSPAQCAPGATCLLKVYCAAKTCPVSAFVSRAVTENVPVQDVFSEWHFDPAGREHLPDCLHDPALASELLFRQHVLNEAANSPALSLHAVYVQAVQMVPAEHRALMPTEVSLNNSFYKHRQTVSKNPR